MKNYNISHDNYDDLEEKLKNERNSKKSKHKVSGKSVFKLEKIIKNRSRNEKK